MSVRVALVVPMLNEAAGLPVLLDAISAQTRRPDEIVFVDAGSSDGSTDIVGAWWDRNRWPDAICHVEENPGGYPGHNRNIGINSTSCTWIAFLDCGIYPEPNWLERLLDYADSSGAQAVFGVCEFFAQTPVARVACALSYGVGSIHPVLPASLFHRDVFAAAGVFDESLRSAEDIKWIIQVERRFGPRKVCSGALVHYRHFPDSITDVAKKWYKYQISSISAGLCNRQLSIFLLIAVIGVAGLLLISNFAQFSVIAYFLFRGVGDPIRRSKLKNWWGHQPMLIFLAPVVALTIDGAKLSGILRSLLFRD